MYTPTANPFSWSKGQNHEITRTVTGQQRSKLASFSAQPAGVFLYRADDTLATSPTTVWIHLSPSQHPNVRALHACFPRDTAVLVLSNFVNSFLCRRIKFSHKNPQLFHKLAAVTVRTEL